MYQKRNYNFMTDNCHAFVAYFMNELQFGGTKRWNMVRLVSAGFLAVLCFASFSLLKKLFLAGLHNLILMDIKKKWVLALTMSNDFAGSHDLLQRQICEHLGLCQDMAAIFGHHGRGPDFWDLEVCCGLGRRCATSADSMVHHVHLLHQQAGWQQACSELCGYVGRHH